MGRATETPPCTNSSSRRGGLVTVQQIYSPPPVLIRHRSEAARRPCIALLAAFRLMSQPAKTKAPWRAFQACLARLYQAEFQTSQNSTIESAQITFNFWPHASAKTGRPRTRTRDRESDSLNIRAKANLQWWRWKY